MAWDAGGRSKSATAADGHLFFLYLDVPVVAARAPVTGASRGCRQGDRNAEEEGRVKDKNVPIQR